MASTNVILRDAFPAGADLSARQHTFVKLNSSGNLVACVAGNGGHALGNAPVQGDAGTVALVGESKITLGTGGGNAGQLITSDINGKGVVATTGDFVNGMLVQTGVAGDIVTFLVAVPTAKF